MKYITKLVSWNYKRKKKTSESKVHFPSAVSQWMLVYHPGFKNCLAYESKDNTESNNGSISCLISNFIKHIWFHLIFIKVPKRDRSPDLCTLKEKRKKGNFINLFKIWFLCFFACCCAASYSLIFFFNFSFLLLIPLIAAEDTAQLLNPWQKSACPCKTAHGCFFYQLLFSGEFLNCLANSLALFLFALFYKRVEDPK